MVGSILGNNVPRVEDPDLVRGRGTFVANHSPERMAHAAFVRSPVAHARISIGDLADARSAPGVLAVYVAGDLELPLTASFGPPNLKAAWHPLATDTVRFVGQAVAVVIAETKAQAVDAAELVDVDYEVLDAVVDMEDALAEGAPQLFEDYPGNRTSGERSDPSLGDVMAGASHVTRLRMVNSRVAVAPMEGQAILAIPGAADDEPAGSRDLTAYVATQMPHLARAMLAGGFGLDPARVRVVAPHVGGAFGGKIGLPAEHAVVTAAALDLGRPVTFAETRSEAMISMQGRCQIDYAELGLAPDGKFVAMRARVVGDGGAYAWFGGTFAHSTTYIMAPGVYRIDLLDYAGAAAVTNTAPIGAFRGAGRPESAAMLERLIDLAADETGIDPVELRRRNFIGPDEFPYTTSAGQTYDSGDYDLPLREALRIADYEGLRAEQARRRERGDVRQLGIGIACYAEITGGGGELGMVEVQRDGSVIARAGTSAHGQGHATTFSMLVADRLGIPLERVRYEQSDTARIPKGSGTGGSRSLQLGGSAVLGAADVVLDRARRLAAEALEVAEADVELSGDGFGVAGVPGVTVSWEQLATRAEDDGDPLHASHEFGSAGSTFPFGAHVSVVEVDTETGLVIPVEHVAVDDCGRVLHPGIVAGQQHGGLAQGIAQALFEEFVYDGDGNPVTGTFADYGIASAPDLPSFTTSNTETPSPLNPLGAKGIGESATVGSTPATHNAVLDALSHLGIRHLDMPLTPPKIVAALARGAQQPGDYWREPPPVFDDLRVRKAGDEDGTPNI